MKVQKTHIILPIVVGTLTPSLAIFLLQMVVVHVSPIHSIGYIARQCAEGSSLFPVMAHCMIPFALLIGITLLQARKVDIVPLNFRFYGGLLGIFIYMLYTH